MCPSRQSEESTSLLREVHGATLKVARLAGRDVCQATAMMPELVVGWVGRVIPHVYFRLICVQSPFQPDACLMTTARRAKDVKHTSTGHARHSKKITVLMAEDNAFLRGSLCALLDAEGHIKVIGQARNGREAVVMANNLQPDVILMDISMPVLNGLQATRQILTANPQAKVVILSIHSDDEYIECMTMVGAVGYLEKQTATEILPSAIHEVFMGHRFYSTAIAKRMANLNIS